MTWFKADRRRKQRDCLSLDPDDGFHHGAGLVRHVFVGLKTRRKSAKARETGWRAANLVIQPFSPWDFQFFFQDSPETIGTGIDKQTKSPDDMSLNWVTLPDLHVGIIVGGISGPQRNFVAFVADVDNGTADLFSKAIELLPNHSQQLNVRDTHENEPADAGVTEIPTNSSQYLSSSSFLRTLSTLISHRPPLEFWSSSHIG